MNGTSKLSRQKVSLLGPPWAPYRQPCKVAQVARNYTRKLAQVARNYTRKLAQVARNYTRKLAQGDSREPRRIVRGAAAALLRATPPPSFSLTLSPSLSFPSPPLSLGALAARAMCLLCRLFESARRARRTHHVVTYYPATPRRRRARASLGLAYTCTYYNTRA